MKAIKRMVIPVLLILMLCSIGILFVGCEEEEKEPVFEIKLYDDNWVELEKEKDGLMRYVDITREYDGKPKGVNIKCFIDGEVFYTHEYLKEKQLYDSPLRVKKNYSENPPDPRDTSVSQIIERGKYDVVIKFVTPYQPNYVYYTESGRSVGLLDLPVNIRHDIIITII